MAVVKFLQNDASRDKEKTTLVFSSEICETFKKTYFDEHMQTTASEL